MHVQAPRITTPAGPRRASGKTTRHPRDESSVERLYLDLRERAMRYAFRPGTHINEQALGRELGVSRAPLREALNRLAAEGLLEFVMNKGFFRKGISVDEIHDLYQVRAALECQAVTLAIARAANQEIRSIQDYWSGVRAAASSMSSEDLSLADEEFHRRLVALAGNKELRMLMDVLMRRIHIARHIDIQRSGWNAGAPDAHTELLALMLERRTDEALACVRNHIGISRERAAEIADEMTSRLLPSAQSCPE